METRHYWEENGHSLKYDSYNCNNGFGRGTGDQLNFAAASEDEGEYPSSADLKKGKVSRQDPMSHRIIEKRRRDRMNNCLADLSKLIPPEYLKKGRGRVEKTEIIEMAIRHLKFLQERANERHLGEEPFRAGYQNAVTEVLRFLVEVQGCRPGDGLCTQLAAHMQVHCEAVTKGTGCALKRDKFRAHGSSSETASSSSSCQGYSMQPELITQTATAPTAFNPEAYNDRQQDESYSMECDRGDAETFQNLEVVPLDGRRKKDTTLRSVRKPEHNEDNLHSYKFKNLIERRFSKSQDKEAAEMSARSAHAPKMYSHKRRRTAKHAPSTSTSASGSTEEANNTSPQLDTSSDSTRHHHYEKPPLPTQYVPVFALNALGKYYVPLSVDYSCLSRHLGPYDPLDARAVQLAAPLHPVTIHVNFQPCLNQHVKREIDDREWQPV